MEGQHDTNQPQGQGPPPPSPKSAYKQAAILAGVMVLTAIIVLVVGGLVTKRTPAKATTPTATTGAEKNTSSPAPAATSPAQTWQTIATIATGDDKKSDTFIVSGSKQRLSYTVTGEPEWTHAIVAFYKAGATSPTDHVTIAAPGPGESFFYLPAGTYYIETTLANCTINLTLEDWR